MIALYRPHLATTMQSVSTADIKDFESLHRSRNIPSKEAANNHDNRARRIVKRVEFRDMKHS